MASSNSTTPKNGAFVFVKPHANFPKVQDKVRAMLRAASITITKEGDIAGAEIDNKKLIDQHYYAIASKATLLEPKDLAVPADKFQEFFGESWADVLGANRACNAMQACERFGVDADGLEAAWRECEPNNKVVKFGGGFYCGLVEVEGKEPLYVFNAFFMSMRSKFTGDGASIHYYIVEWDPETLNWADFRGKVLGPTDPAAAPEGSIRKIILREWQSLGLKDAPNKGDNGVHASASPFEGLAEKTNWAGLEIHEDPFGKALLSAGISAKTIKAWSVDPRVKLPNNEGEASIFDTLEDMDAKECLSKCIVIDRIEKAQNTSPFCDCL
mmetsp:Transcript_8103/g.12395  ORF Transcript_8103/g.12395 Transcript_8103/m.12395 type:complete len:327 (-) Transcript_8103:175-1155(-)